MTPDVVVAGAGVTGLTAAQELSARGLTVVVLEARDRLGGRIHTVNGPDNTPIELGAQVIHADNPVLSLFAPNDLAHQPDPDRTLVWRDGSEPFNFGSAHPMRVAAQLSALSRVMGALADTMTLPRGLQMLKCSDQTATEYRAWVEQLTGVDPRDVTLGRIVSEVAWSAAPGSKCVPTLGMSEIVKRLESRYVDVRLSCPVRHIEVQRDGARLRCDDGQLDARAVLLTAPPTVVASGELSLGGLAAPKMALAPHLPAVPGTVRVFSTRTLLTDSGFAFLPRVGLLTWRQHTSAITLVSKGVPATRLTNMGSRSLAGQVSRMTGLPVEEVAAHDWTTDPFAHGAFTHADVRPETARAWAEPVGALAMAGEACAAGPSHPYIDRAARSAERAIAHLSSLHSKELARP